MEKQNSTIKIFWFFFRPYRLRILLLFVLSLLLGVLEAAAIAAVYPILSAAFNPGIIEGNFILVLFRKTAALLPIKEEFIAFCLLFLLLALSAFIVRVIYINFKMKLASGLVRKNQEEIFRKFVHADYQYFIDHKQGQLIYNIRGAPVRLSRLTNSITELLSQAILSISVLVILFSLSWKGTLAVLVVGLGYYYLTRILGRRISYHAAKVEMETATEANVLLNEIISGIKQVKVFVTWESWIVRFRRVMRKYWNYFIKRSIWEQIPTPFLTLILYLTIGIVAILIKMMVPNSFMELIPVFGTFAFALFRLVPFIGNTGQLTMSIIGALPDCERVYTLRNEIITNIKDGEKELSSFESEIKFENVTFAYKGREKTMENVSVTLEKGKTIAIVGRSGEGKTTLINLILRLFDPDEGEIKIDGLNIKEYKLSSWLNNVGFVSQDTFILNDTVENNITFCSDGYSREEVIKAASYADAHDFINKLPDGYNTFVGAQGMRISGGQAQRIAVARAMIREPEILIFDEATNNLDSISETTVQKAIDEISKDHTVIIVAHRLSTIANADKIIVLENGRLVEEGTHKELMSNKGTYWELYQSQPL